MALFEFDDGRPGEPDHSMQKVLDALAARGPKPIETLSPQEARQQPTAADGAQDVMRTRGLDPNDDLGVATKDFEIPTTWGAIKARLYGKQDDEGTKPVVVYFRGGGWVIASLDVYDATPRSLAKATDCIFVSCDYRMAPEHKFPAAHDDAWEAWNWVTRSAASFGGDPERVAVMGESAGGNLAANVAIRARDEGGVQPAAVVLVYPVAGNDMNTESYVENANAKPLNKAMMQWFVGHVFQNQAQAADPRINLVAVDLADLPPTMIIGAEIDPLRSEGRQLAERLEAAGNDGSYKCYEGVTHEFFGMGLVVKDAAVAQGKVAFELKKRLRHGILGKIADALS